MSPLGYWVYVPIPAVRVFEFCIGCLAATTLESKLHWAWPASAAVLISVFYVGMFYTAELFPNECDKSIWSFVWSAPFTNYCILEWDYATPTKFAAVWALFIQWLAAAELHDVPDRTFRFLEESHLLQTLSTFSLHLYLGHTTINRLLSGLAMHMRFQSQLGLHTTFIIVYSVCYLLKVYLQPLLDRAVYAEPQINADDAETHTGPPEIKKNGP
jgi:hypothetical protein